MEFKTDVLIIGSGIAGLSFALKVAPYGKVTIVTKKTSAESSTNYAQGGIAAVLSPEDTFESHIKDTLIAGDGLCHEDVVKIVVEEGPDRIAELVDWGVGFSQRTANGETEYDLGKEGGHTKRRIIHAKDFTGREVERALLAQVDQNPNITLLENHIAVDLLIQSKISGTDHTSRPGKDRHLLGRVCIGYRRW